MLRNSACTRSQQSTDFRAYSHKPASPFSPDLAAYSKKSTPCSHVIQHYVMPLSNLHYTLSHPHPYTHLWPKGDVVFVRVDSET